MSGSTSAAPHHRHFIWLHLLLLILSIHDVSASGSSSSPKSKSESKSQSKSVESESEEKQGDVKSCLAKNLKDSEKRTCRLYSLMIDAGSTGTRIDIFEFSHNTNKSAFPFKLENETYMEIKVGLSDFADDPAQGSSIINPLIEKAKSVVPQNLWSVTPLALKATGGFRLLPAAKAELILKEVRKLFASCPFMVSNDSVSILSGTDEGVFGWATVNFLLDRLDVMFLKHGALYPTFGRTLTVAALDLGGASTQITYQPSLDISFSSAPGGFLKEVTLFKQTVLLYTHSYLGNGVVAARLNILRQSSNRKKPEQNQFSTACLPPGYEHQWNYSSTTYYVSGSSNYSRVQCKAEVDKSISASKIDRQMELVTSEIYAFSYLFERLQHAGLIKSGVVGVYLTISDVDVAAKKACTKPKFGSDSWQPWLCMDLTYIHSLLSLGYGLPADKPIYFVHKLRNLVISWTLGATYNSLYMLHESGVSDYSAVSRDFVGRRLGRH